VWLEEPPLPALAGALGQVALYVGNDSGVSHLAAAVGAPAVALFTEAHLRWRPWSAAARVVVVSTAALGERDVDAVTAAARALLA
jgi:ADP-heptose:LPS heptosyltransferase